MEFHKLGDINLPKTNWSNISSNCSWESRYMNFLSDKFTSPLLHESTHSGGNTLDNVLSNDFQCLSLLSIGKDSSISDHYPILIQFDCGSCNSTVPCFSAFTFNSAQQMTVFRELSSSFSFLRLSRQYSGRFLRSAK